MKFYYKAERIIKYKHELECNVLFSALLNRPILSREKQKHVLFLNFSHIRLLMSHQEDEIILFASWFCPYVQRVWIALEHKRLKYRYIEIDPYSESEGRCYYK